MNKILNNAIIKKSGFDVIKPLVTEYYINNNIIVDSFWETHVKQCNFYLIMYENNIIGYFSIHKGTLLVLFNVFEEYRNVSQELFSIIKKYETIKEVFVPTGDEFLLSHVIDNYTKLEKQAYFSIYTDKDPDRIIDLEFVLADVEKDIEILKLEHDFLKHEIENIKNLVNEELYIVKYENNVIGFGVIEYNSIVDIYASIGMIVREEYRQKGYGTNILNGLKKISKSKGRKPISGCWYYNHNSKKTMESAGAYSKTRLLRFYF
jgi:predicted acetyltransferase